MSRPSYYSEPETAEYKGHTITVEWYYDTDMGEPWKECDGHGPVSEWTSRKKAPGERVLVDDTRSRFVRYYDWAEAIRIAKRDRWDAPPYKTGTPGQRAVRAVEADFEYLRRWCKDDWHWVGRVVKIDKDVHDSCWGFESDSIRQETEECIQNAKEYIDSEEEETEWAANHEIQTV